MKYQNFVGMPLLTVLNELNKAGVSYIIKEQNVVQKNYDAVLVVRITKSDDKLVIVTDRFLLDK